MDDKLPHSVTIQTPGGPVEALDLTALAEDIIARLQSLSPGRLSEVIIMRDLRTSGDGRAIGTALGLILESAWERTAMRASATLVIGADGGGRETTFYVRDNGAGFDGTLDGPDNLSRDPCAGSLDDLEDGGPLAEARQIIQALGGRIRVEPAAVQGVTVHFTFGERDGTAAQ